MHTIARPRSRADANVCWYSASTPEIRSRRHQADEVEKLRRIRASARLRVSTLFVGDARASPRLPRLQLMRNSHGFKLFRLLSSRQHRHRTCHKSTLRALMVGLAATATCSPSLSVVVRHPQSKQRLPGQASRPFESDSSPLPKVTLRSTHGFFICTPDDEAKHSSRVLAMSRDQSATEKPGRPSKSRPAAPLEFRCSTNTGVAIRSLLSL